MSKKERLTDEQLLAQFEGIDESRSGSKRNSQSAKSGNVNSLAPTKDAEDDILQELGIPERVRPLSRAQTPKPIAASTSATASPRRGHRNGSPVVSPEDSRTSEERAQSRKSADSSRSFHTSLKPKPEASAKETSAVASTELESEVENDTASGQTDDHAKGGGSWWSTITSTASAAVKQAEAIAKEIKSNEEAQRWAEQVKGNVGNLKNIGDELRSRALPTFTNLLHTLAPPISSHERLQIHITHDLLGYPALDPLVYATFSRVMAQVEGGDLMVIQRGQESMQRQGDSTDGSSASRGGNNAGWADGPWWRQPVTERNLGAVSGLIEGNKLCKASAQSYATEYYNARGGIEEAAKQATEILSESSPVRTSDIFFAVQAITIPGASSTEQPDTKETKTREDVGGESSVSFAVHLHDPIHGIALSTCSQSMPQKWTEWLDASVSTEPTSPAVVPADIADIIQNGGVDPREWVAEWLEESISLAIGIVAQRYVAQRMGVVSDALGRARQQVVELGGGEAARAV